MDEATRQALIAALRLQLDWGADEALEDTPTDRRSPARAAAGSSEAASVETGALPAALPRPAAAGSVAPARGAGDGAGPGAGQSVLAEAEALAASAGTLAALREAIAGFGGMALRETATSLVFADGPPDAPVMLIGEAPGAEEDREGKPFVGASGRLLDRMLGSIGLSRHGSGWSSCYISNILAWRPPGNRNPTDAEVALSLPFIRRHIALARPRLLVLLGAVAVRSLTGTREGITRVRGRWLDVKVAGRGTVPALATLHPAYLLRNPGAKRDAWADLLALRHRLEQIRQE